jgi:hypothetical protein
MFKSGPDPRNPPDRPGKAAPDPPDIVVQPEKFVDFRSRGGGPVGHPQGVRGKTLPEGLKPPEIYQVRAQTNPKIRHCNLARGSILSYQ